MKAPQFKPNINQPYPIIKLKQKKKKLTPGS